MLTDLCVFVLNDLIIDGQMLGMQVVSANVRVDNMMKQCHTVSTSCEQRV